MVSMAFYHVNENAGSTFSFIKGNRKSVVDRERALPRLPALPYRRDEIC